MELSFFEIVEAASVLPVEVVITFALVKTLRIKRAAAFWITRMLLIGVICFFRSTMDPAVRMAFGFSVDLLLPLPFAEGKLSRRVFVVVLVNVALSIAEIAGAALWLALTGMPLAEGASSLHPVEFWTVRVFHILLMIMLLSGIYVFLDRLSSGDVEGGIRFFAVLPVTQVALLSISLAIMQYLPHRSDFFNYGNLVLAVLCVIVDVFLFFSLDRYGKRQQSEQRAELLRRQLDEYLKEYRVVAESVESVARLRHDLRNQLQVVASLYEQGRCNEAREFLHAMIVQCEQANKLSAEEVGHLPSSVGSEVRR